MEVSTTWKTGVSGLRDSIALLEEIAPYTVVKVGSFARFAKELDQFCGGLLKTDPKNVSEAQFCGVEVRESRYLPENVAVVMHDGQVFSLIRFADA